VHHIQVVICHVTKLCTVLLTSYDMRDGGCTAFAAAAPAGCFWAAVRLGPCVCVYETGRSWPLQLATLGPSECRGLENYNQGLSTNCVGVSPLRSGISNHIDHMVIVLNTFC
jgi:hypothetical protein